MIDRRWFNAGLVTSLAVPLSALSLKAYAESSLVEDPLPAMAGGDKPDARLSDYLSMMKSMASGGGAATPKGQNVLGTGVPKPTEQSFGDKIIHDAPCASTPLQVAEYFRPENLLKVHGKGADEYARGWPLDVDGKIFSRNPVVFEFLRHMKHIGGDDGDESDWCASFVYWCVARAQAAKHSQTVAAINNTYRHPGARTFWCFGEETKTPKRGDIAVWLLKGHTISCPFDEKQKASGHVAFYLDDATIQRPNGKKVDALWVLGGNQGLDDTSVPPFVDGRNSWVCQKKYPKEYKTMSGKTHVFAGFRTASILHKKPPAKPCTEADKAAGLC